ncbi:MAG: hypothetical protein ACK5LZ_04090 [Anaerorhabdus sp.]
MSVYRTMETLNRESENGIWLEFFEQTWIFMIKDDCWADEEIMKFKEEPIKLSYFQKGIIDGFLIEINDMLEISDTPFCLLEATRGFFNTLKDQQTYKIMVLLIDKNNQILVRKEGNMSNLMSEKIKASLRLQRQNQYDLKGFNIALTKLQKRYEPYELTEFVVFSEKIIGNILK